MRKPILHPQDKQEMETENRHKNQTWLTPLFANKGQGHIVDQCGGDG
jgi:hypothetical protein